MYRIEYKSEYFFILLVCCYQILSPIKCIFIFFQCVGHISGAHLNPAITIATVILGKKSITIAGFYIIAQCLGSLLGYGLLKVNEYIYIHLFIAYKKYV